MKPSLKILFGAAPLILFVFSDLRAADLNSDQWSAAALIDKGSNECRDYSGTTIVIVDTEQANDDEQKAGSLDVIYRNDLDRDLIVLGASSVNHSGGSAYSQPVAVYCQLIYEMQPRAFSASTESSDGVRAAAEVPAGSQGSTSEFYLYYPIASDGSLVTAFSGGSRLRNATLIDSIETALKMN